MGRELTCYFIKEDSWITEQGLSWERDEELFSLFKKHLPMHSSKPLKDVITTYEHTEDAYREPLQFAFAGVVETVLRSHPKKEGLANLSDWNQAIAAFIHALPSSTPIVFYWC